MSTKPVIAEHIEMTAGVCGGKPRIAGTRIRVQDVVIWHDHCGLSPEEIVGEFPHLTLADVYAALAYYHDHAEEIRALIQAEEDFADRLAAECPSLLNRKPRGRNAPDDSVSPG